MTFSATFRSAAALALMTAAMTGCSAFEPEYTACPSIKAVEGAENVATKGTILGQDIAVRLNGVAAKCVATSSGHDLELEVGLLARRDMSSSAKTEEMKIDITLAYLDKDDNPVGRDVSSFKAYFNEFNAKSRPTFVISTEIPAGTRVIMGLGKLKDGE
ncbi:MAG: hypothetical protein J4F41_00375 [Alphaproteobacteria bacterium]|nr:hypothetical protein [Alphaproteobacteria bacterium]